jgi:putative membrane protein
MEENTSENHKTLILMSDDPRVILAAERTLLAWIRTGLAMMGFGFLVARFGMFMEEFAVIKGVPSDGSPAWSVWIGAAMVLLGTLVNFASGIEHGRYSRSVQGVSVHFSSGYRFGIVCALSLAVLGAMMTVRLLLL